jgi:hypothetical protein
LSSWLSHQSSCLGKGTEEGTEVTVTTGVNNLPIQDTVTVNKAGEEVEGTEGAEDREVIMEGVNKGGMTEDTVALQEVMEGVNRVALPGDMAKEGEEEDSNSTGKVRKAPTSSRSRATGHPFIFTFLPNNWSKHGSELATLPIETGLAT